MPHCIVVKRGDVQRYDLLYKTFSSQLPVIWDRRRQEPRVNPATGKPEGQEDRRHAAPPSWTALGFVVVDR